MGRFTPSPFEGCSSNYFRPTGHFERRKIMFEIELGGKGWARGRNGYFVPRRLDGFQDTKGMVNLSVLSSRTGKSDPISLRLTKGEAVELGTKLFSIIGIRKAHPKVVIVVEGGNVQSIFSDQPVQVVKVDYDTEGTPREELKRVLQIGDEGEKSYELAFVRHWGEAEVCPEETERFFRNAMD
jgi:hypothetical protein